MCPNGQAYGINTGTNIVYRKRVCLCAYIYVPAISVTTQYLSYQILDTMGGAGQQHAFVQGRAQSSP